jgi:hypothetical protein
MREPISGKPVVINLPTATPDQLVYLEEIERSHEASEQAVRDCTCTFGGAGSNRPYKPNPACPVHGKRS